MGNPEVIIIGAGPSGISFAHTLKHKYGLNDFTVSCTPLELQLAKARRRIFDKPA